MNWTWTWSGRFFGYWSGSDLWTYQGKHIGRRRGLEIYGPSGRYLGEVMGNDRLATNKAKAALMGPAFVPLAARTPELVQADLDSFPLYKGFEDFPGPEQS